jgi:hypothetical protein
MIIRALFLGDNITLILRKRLEKSLFDGSGQLAKRVGLKRHRIRS